MAVATRVSAPLRLRLPALARRVDWPRLAPGLLAFAVLLSVGLADGGLFPRTWRLATLAFAALAGAALLARPRAGLARREWLVVAALSAYTGLMLVSAAWSGRPSAAETEAERALIYPAALLAILLVSRRASLTHLLAGALAGITGACSYGLAIYLFTSPPLDPVEGKLLFQPLGYANGLGIFATVGALLSLGLALAANRRAIRALALVPLLVIAPTLYYTSSRGSYVAFAAGVGVLVVCAGRISRRTGTALGAVAALALAAVVAASGADVLSGENRLHYWDVAWRDFTQHPLHGSGAGTFFDYWVHHRTVDLWVRSPHSLYLGALAELGVVGLAILLLAVLPPLLALGGRRDPTLAAAGAAYVAFVLHAGVDWDWELPAVTLAGLFCGAALLVAGRRADPRSLSWRARVALLVPIVAAGTLACIRLKTGANFPFAA